MHYTELFRQGELYSIIQQGYVSVRDHLEFPLRIYNYTDKAQYDQVWNNVTMNCRGLIVDYDGNIVARGFPKFFNYGQPGAAEIALDDVVQVTDKMDGSLGIMYQCPDGSYAIATRGSFHSDQAIFATNVLRTRYPGFQGIDGGTVLFEIVYPDNRIVLDYGDMADLVLLGSVNNETGRSYGPNNPMVYSWPGPKAEDFGSMTLAEALALPPRVNAEGIVVRSYTDGAMLKYKQEDYVRLHRLVFGLSEKAVWEHLSTHDGDISGMLEGLPDEFHGWVRGKANDLTMMHSIIREKVWSLYNSMWPEYGILDRKSFALAAYNYPEYRSYLFMCYDDKDISSAIWRSLKPKGASPMVRVSEDVA